MSICKKNDQAYFASSNSYIGFKSYFNRIFDSKDFTKIYVLKGGPGTGKSTIMKKACELAEECNYSYEKFYCSSDPSSLDGVILTSARARMAIIDGTSPHERDAVIPGAVDELINLGAAFNVSALEAERKVIENLNDKKKISYSNAYRCLSFSFDFERKLRAELLKLFDIQAARKAAYSIYDTLFSSFSDRDLSDIRLISSFSKEGYSRLPIPESFAKRVYNICGRFGSEFIFMNILNEILTEKNIKFRAFPSPLSVNDLEAISFTNSNTVILTTKKEAYINTEEFIRSDISATDKDMLNLHIDGKEFFLKKASKYLSEASEYHFKLEEIYSEHINFDIVNTITGALFEKIKIILS